MNSIKSTYKIRRAERKDLCAISDIYNYEVANGTATFDIHTSTMPELETWFAAHNVDNHPLIVIETEGQVAGYASLSKYRDKEAYAGTVELSVYVGYEFRGRGYAKALVSELIGMAKRDPATHVIVSVITGGTTQASAFTGISASHSAARYTKPASNSADISASTITSLSSADKAEAFPVRPYRGSRSFPFLTRFFLRVCLITDIWLDAGIVNKNIHVFCRK